MRVAIAVIVIGLFPTMANAQQFTPAQCAQLAQLIARTQAAANQAQGASAQQSFILQALQNYQAMAVAGGCN
jgi:hypothetical protein